MQIEKVTVLGNSSRSLKPNNPLEASARTDWKASVMPQYQFLLCRSHPCAYDTQESLLRHAITHKRDGIFSSVTTVKWAHL